MKTRSSCSYDSDRARALLYFIRIPHDTDEREDMQDESVRSGWEDIESART